MSLSMSNLLAGVRADLDEPTEAVWLDVNLLSWINQGVMRVATALRSVRDDHLVVRMTSQDVSSLINGASYNPASLQIVSGTDRYTLPPDLIEIRALEPLLDADKDSGVSFVSQDLARPEFRRLTRVTTSSASATTFAFDIIGVNTLLIAPTPARTIELDLLYVRHRQDYTVNDVIAILPDYAEAALRAYAVYRAFRAISHQDTGTQLQVYRDEEATVKSFSRPRQSKNIVIAQDYFADDGDGFELTVDFNS